MASTVITAFKEFLQNKVNLASDDTDGARKSRDWLFGRIRNFPNLYSDFPLLFEGKNISFGSFARRTKIRPLDDVDLISCISGTGGVYYDNGYDPITITVPAESRLSAFCNDNSLTLNSIKIINLFVKALSLVAQYSSAEKNRRSEAAVLKLKSYPWNFDIVPGFFTTEDDYGRTYYIIPDGAGHWKKTDPRKDRDRITRINREHDGHLLNVIRIMKYWNKRPTMPSASSYLLECMIASFYENSVQKAKQWVDMEIAPVLRYIAAAILTSVYDPKGIQGDLNTLTLEQRMKIRNRALLDAIRADEAGALEQAEEHKKSIRKWSEIFGSDFPEYG